MLLRRMLETTPRRERRHERRRGLVILLVLILVVGGPLVVGGGWWFWATGSAGAHERLVIQIPSGASGSQVADLLKEKGVIRSSTAFRLLAKFRHQSGGFEAGTYTTLATNMTPEQALTALEGGPLPKKTIKATFPEGLTVAQTAQRAQDELGILRKDFVTAATSGTWTLPPYLPKDEKTLEGFLYPQTYDFEAGVDANDTIKRLLDEFVTATKDLPWDNYKKLGLKSRYQVVIVASMIEREAKFDEDRGKIATVIYNRLKKGMPLQIDATVEYALGTYKPKLTFQDLKVDSPYNTYLHTGLPPTPIASPGLASIEAALSPTPGDWLYYVVIDAAGHHGFASTYSEFLRLKNQYKG